MENNHACLKIVSRPSDFILGVNSPIKLNAVSDNWISHIGFFERQLLADGDSNCCVIFSAQESMDAQIDALMPSLPASLVELFNTMGFMDAQNSTDGQTHFHSSPRFLAVLTGNYTNGNGLPEPWDCARKFGIVPYKDLPITPGMTVAQFFAPIPQALLDKGTQFLAAIGGKQSFQYHYITSGVTNLPAMESVLPAAPLCLGINTGDNWNVVDPPAPPVGSSPGHSVMNYLIDPQDNCFIYDHYLPNPKELVNGYPIPFSLQGIVTPNPPPPAPVPPSPTFPANPNPAQTAQWLVWLQKLWTWMTIIE